MSPTGTSRPAIVRLSPYAWSYEIDQLATQLTTAAEVREWMARGGRVLIADEDLNEFRLDSTQYHLLAQWQGLKRRLSMDSVVTALTSGSLDPAVEHIQVIQAR